MTDGPGLSAWDRVHAAFAPADALRSAELARELSLRPRQSREPVVDIADRPGWPGWAKPLGSVPEGDCQTCGGPLNPANRGRINETSVCGKCGHRLGGTMRRRTKLALRLFRAGEWKP